MKSRDIWIHKDTDDFLNYLKFEYQQVVMVAVSVVVSVLLSLMLPLILMLLNRLQFLPVTIFVLNRF